MKAAHALGIAIILDVVYNHFGWGDTRPDYGCGEVRRYIHGNAMMWLGECRMDGLRYDLTLYICSVSGHGGDDIYEGWTLAQWINHYVHLRFRRKIAIGEDLRDNASITESEDLGGANFGSQRDARFVDPVRAALIDPDMGSVARASRHRYGRRDRRRLSRRLRAPFHWPLRRAIPCKRPV